MPQSGLLTASGGTVGPQAPGIGHAPFISGAKLEGEDAEPDRVAVVAAVGLTTFELTAFLDLGFRLGASLTGCSGATGVVVSSAGAMGAWGNTGATTAIGFTS